MADAVKETIVAPENNGLDKDKMADKLEQNIAAALKANKDKINAADPANTIEMIDAKNDSAWIGRNNDSDILGSIAKGFADSARQNRDGAYTKLAEAQSLLTGSSTAVAKQAANGANRHAGIIPDPDFDEPPGTPVTRGSTPAGGTRGGAAPTVGQ